MLWLPFLLCGLFSSALATTDWYHTYWCGHGGLQYLDDENCVKKFPNGYDREWTCPVPEVDRIPPGFQKEGELSSVSVDTTSLTKYVTDSAINVCTVVTKRVKDLTQPSGFSLYNRYFCAGERSMNEGYETWSR